MPARRPQLSPLRLTRDRIVDAALQIVQTLGYDALSMRSLAAELDTGQASLYAHVANKTELDRLIVTRVLRELPEVDEHAGDWRTYSREWWKAWRGQLAAYPGLAKAYFASAPDDPEFLALEEAGLRRLRLAGLDARQAGVAEMAMFMFTAGRSLEDAVIEERIAESGLSKEDWFSEVRRLRESLPAEQFPYLRESLLLVSPEDREHNAIEAVELILDGIEARYLSRRPQPD